MKRGIALLALVLAVAAPAFAQSAPGPSVETMEHLSGGAMPVPTRTPVRTPAAPVEDEVAPYEHSNANAGATPFKGSEMLKAFHGREGIARISASLVHAVQQDKRTAGIFRAADIVRLERTLNEQFCHILNGGCDYTGRDMKSTHEDHGITMAEFNAVVELLQGAMDGEHVAPAAQNRLLAKLAPMKRDVAVR